MSKVKKYNIPEYTQVFYLIYNSKYKILSDLEFEAKIPHATFMRIIKYLVDSRLIILQSMSGKNRKIPIVNFTGINTFIMLTFFKKELIELNKDFPTHFPLYEGINYFSYRMTDLIKAHLDKEFKVKISDIDFGIHKLFMNLIKHIGNIALSVPKEYQVYSKMRNYYRLNRNKLPKKLPVDFQIEVFMVCDNLFHKIKTSKKLGDIEQKVLTKMSLIKKQDVFEIIIGCSIYYVAKLNNIDFFELIEKVSHT